MPGYLLEPHNESQDWGVGKARQAVGGRRGDSCPHEFLEVLRPASVM